MLSEVSSFSRNKLNMFNLFRLCRKDEISRKTRSILLLPKGNNVEATFDFIAATSDFVEQIVQLVALYNYYYYY